MDGAAGTLRPLRMIEGVWEAIYEGVSAPSLKVTHLERPVENVDVQPNGEGVWLVRVPIPPETLSDGVQTYLVEEAGQKIGHFAIAAGSPLAEDLRAEIELLRAELDMLKAAFRRHCLETMERD